MADESFDFDLNISIQKLLDSIEKAVKGGKSLDTILKSIKDELKQLQGGANLQKFFQAAFGDNVAAVAQFLDSVEKAKQELIRMGVETKAPLDAVVASLRNVNAVTKEFSGSAITQAANQLKQEIKEVEIAAKAAAETQRLSNQTSTASFLASTTAAAELRTNINTVKDRLRELQAASSDSLAVVVQGFKEINAESKEFSNFEISQAVNEIKEFEGSLDNLRGGFDENKASIIQFRSNVENIKVQLTSLLQETGKPLSDVVEGFRSLNRTTKDFSAAEITKAFKELSSVRLDNLKQLFVELQKGGSSVRDLEARFGSLSQVLKGFTPQEISKVVEEVRKLGQETEKASRPVKQLSDETKNASQSANLFGQTLQQVDRISTFFFGTTLANLALGVLRRLINSMDEVIDRGIEFSRTQFNLITSVRALQRVGVDVTFAEFNEQISRLREQFNFFTQRELSEGIAQIALLTRNVEISKEEIFKLSEATATLAIITGKDFGEQGLLVARSIASGYTEALQRAGIAANRLAIQQKALELGINKSFLQMTEQERAAVTLALVLDQIAAVSEDAALFQETMAGKVQANKTSLREFADSLGLRVLPFFNALLEMTVLVAKAFGGMVDIVLLELNGLVAKGGGLVAGFILIFRNLRDGVEFNLDDIVEVVKRTANQLQQEFNEKLFSDIFSTGQDITGDAFGQFADQVEEELNDDVDKLIEKIQDVITRFENSVRDAFIKFQRRLADIDTKAFRQRLDAGTKLSQDLEKLNRQTEDKLADAQAKFRENELKAERKFQEDLRKLREGFLFDLEDALIERDAKQVLRLLRQFNLRKDQLERQKNEEDRAREDAFQSELQDIALQKERRVRELIIEFEERKLAIEENRQRERDDTAVAYARELVDLNRHHQDRLRELRDNLTDELKLWFDFYLTLGRIQFEYYKLNKIIGGAIGSNVPDVYNPLKPGGGPAPPPTHPLQAPKPQPPPKQLPKSFAQGGTLVAKRPTLAVFGETPEVVTFSPLNRVGSNEGRVFGGSLPNASGGRGRVMIEMFLSPDLIANVKDETLGEVADIIVRRT